MICFNCGCNLPETEMHACRLCGMRMPLGCLECGSSNPEFAKFCLACGNPLAGASLARPAAADVLQESRRNVAVLFADVSGFTALSEKLDPEEVRTLINDCFQTITRPVYELEGTIDKYIGDCVMVLFGAKYAHTDDPVRAVDCAQSMLSLIRAFSEERLASRGLSLTLSIGVNYGLVVTGRVGNYFDKDYTVMGDVVNTAQRLQSAAASGSVLVSESVREEARDAWDFVDIGTVQVKNKRDPVRCFSPSTRRQRQAHGKLLLERSEPMTLLLERISPPVISKAPHPMGDTATVRATLLTGDPGTGKTTLAHALAEGLEERYKVIWTDCGSTWRHRAHHAVSMLLHGIMNINPDESDPVKHVRVTSYSYWLFGGTAHEQVEKTVQFLGILMGIGSTPAFRDILRAMRHEDIERELVDRTVSFLDAVTARQPHFFVIDGFQWADDSSVALLAEVLGHSERLPLFLLLISRHVKPEWEPLMKRMPVLAIEPLGNEAAVTLALDRLGAARLDPALEEQLHRMTQGNPLLIEEWVSVLRRRDRIVLTDGTALLNVAFPQELPSTMESLVLTTLSELPDDTVAFLQTAAVIGSEFRLSWPAALLPNPSDADRMLAEGIEAGLLATRSVSAGTDRVEKTCGFRHDAARESIISSLLLSRRTDIHLRFASWLEKTGHGDAETALELLFEHYDSAGLPEKADVFLYRLALRQRGDFRYEAALNTLIRLIERRSGSGDQALLHSAMRECGTLCILMSRYDEAFAILTDALALNPAPDDRHAIGLMLAEIHMENARYPEALERLDEMELRVKNDPQFSGSLMRLKSTILRLQSSSGALAYARHAAAQLRKSQDSANLTEVLSQMAFIHFSRGAVPMALKELNQAYELAEKANNLGAMARLSGNLGIIHHASGSVSKSLSFLTKAIDLAGQVSNLHSQTSSRINLGILHLEKGQFDAAQKQLDEAVKQARQTGLAYHECLALLNTGELNMERGDTAAAQTAWKQACSLAETHGLPCEETLALLGLARLDMPHSLAMLDTLRDRCDGLEDSSITAEVEQYRSVCLSLLGRASEAMAACRSAMREADVSENRFGQLRVRRLSGILSHLTGDDEAAAAMLETAVSSARELESDYEAAKGEFWLARVKAADPKAVDAHRNRAKAILTDIGPCRWRTAIETPGGEEIGTPLLAWFP